MVLTGLCRASFARCSIARGVAGGASIGVSGQNRDLNTTSGSPAPAAAAPAVAAAHGAHELWRSAASPSAATGGGPRIRALLVGAAPPIACCGRAPRNLRPVPRRPASPGAGRAGVLRARRALTWPSVVLRIASVRCPPRQAPNPPPKPRPRRNAANLHAAGLQRSRAAARPVAARSHTAPPPAYPPHNLRRAPHPPPPQVDAAGTLLVPSEPVADVYLRVAARHGVVGLDGGAVLDNFRR